MADLGGATLIGREVELARLSALVRHATRTVLTIDGPGGVGKTAIAIELADRMASEFRQGAAFVSLAALDDPRLLCSEVARALGLGDADGAHPIDRLVWGLRGQQMLLVLDNFEHLIDAADVVGELSTRCSDLSIVVTSRRRLNVPNEQIFVVRGLPVAATAGEAQGVPAVDLFVRRATAANPTLELAAAEIDSVAEICRLLHGVPQAIEVVASLARTLTITEIAARLSDDQAPGEVDSAIAWSYDLLQADAHALLPRLAVFADSWSLDAMQAVCEADDADFAQSLDALLELIDLHLVEPLAGPNGEARFGLLDTTRRFALRELERSGEAAAMRQAHADHYVALAGVLGARLESASQRQAAIEIGLEMANFRAAMTHLLDAGRSLDGLSLSGSLGLYWLDRGSPHEGREWLQRFLDLDHDHDPTPAMAIADGWEARFAFNDSMAMPLGWDGGSGPAAVELHTRLTTDRDILLGVAGDVRGAMRVAEHIVYLAGVRGLVDDVAQVVEPLVAVATTSEENWMVADLLRAWATVLRDNGQPKAAHEINERTIEVASATRNQSALARALLNVAMSARSSPAQARAEVEPIFPMLIDNGDLGGATQTAITAATLALDEGDLTAAAAWWSNTIDLAVRTGSGNDLMRGVSGAMSVAQQAGRSAEAARLCGGMRLFEEQFKTRLPPEIFGEHVERAQQIADSLGARFETESAVGQEAGWDATVKLATALLTELRNDVAPRAVRRRGPRANAELTDRELDVLSELVAGRTNQQIGDHLSISAKTVMHHTMSVYRKLAVRGRAEAVAHAIRAGLVDA
jgi:predicted ATPase/DNA-binding CsgD family transcriptional regulator